ncbi:MAG: 3-deoxy-D-manno-octulosonic acid transferase [Alphaproteobacteria bacterium]|nr:3-deoxy-D-manno-octulosonic acid transferase [Alphaproteobacteria bacterium]
MFIRTYKFLISLLFPLIKVTYIRKRRRIGKEHPTRFNERLGIYTYPRPEGKLLWFHGASVGEAISMLPLIDKLLKEDEQLFIMVTTGTLTSAEIMAKRLPERAFHQFVPFDVPRYAKRLLNHFKPDAVLWFESEFWPSLISETAARKIPLILVNGRVSDRSFAKWKKFGFAAKEILQCFTLCLGQSEQDKERLQILGAPKTACVGNIKYAGMKLPVDEEKLKVLQNAIGNRPIFLISSTHYNEEEQLAEYLPQLKQLMENLLVIVVPRHPNRGDEVTAMFRERKFNTVQRSKAENIENKTEVYVADTIGEMGLWYQLAPVTFVGGSLIAHGGQNFIEPAKDHNAIILGPHMHNFTDMTERAQNYQAVIKVDNAKEVIEAAERLFANPNLMQLAQQKAYDWTQKEAQVLDGIAAALKEELKR